MNQKMNDLRFSPEMEHWLNTSVHNIAPERGAEIRTLVQQYGIALLVQRGEEQDANFNVYLSERRVEVGARALERLWTQCLATWVMFRKLSEVGYGNTIDANADPRMAPVFELLAKAISAKPFVPTSVDLSGVPDKWFAEAREMFLCACAWCLLHETGHVALGHGIATSATAKQEELDADDFASDWMLSRWQEFGTDENILLKRAGGALLALLYIASHEVYKRTYGGRTHPDPPDRINHFITKHLPPESDSFEVLVADVPRHLVAIALQLHMQSAGVEIDEREYASNKRLR